MSQETDPSTSLQSNDQGIIPHEELSNEVSNSESDLLKTDDNSIPSQGQPSEPTASENPTGTGGVEPPPTIAPGEASTPTQNEKNPEAPLSGKSSSKSNKSQGSKKGKSGKSAKPNTKSIKAEIDQAKQQIAEANKQIAQLDKDTAQIKEDDAFAEKEIDFHRLEQDELQRQFQIAQQELADKEILLANKERECEEIKELAAAEKRVYQMKVKHLMAANQNEFAQTYLEGEQELYQERLQMQADASDAIETSNAKRSDTNDLQLQNDTLMTKHRMEQDKVFTQLREEFEAAFDEKRAAHERDINAMRQQLEEKREQMITELEDRKNEQIKELREKHARSFDNIKRYFSGITHSNLEQIKGKKTTISQNKVQINKIRKEVEDLNAQRKKLQEPLNDLIQENEKLTEDIDLYKKDKRDLARNKQKIKALEDELRDLQLSMEVLEQRFEQLEKERDGLYDQFDTSIHDVRQKTEFRAYILEQKVKKLHEELDLKDMQLKQVMEKAGIESPAIAAKIDDVLAEKNAKINQLEVQLARVTKAHNTILTAYEAKMEKYGIPKEELGFSEMPEHVNFEPECED